MMKLLLLLFISMLSSSLSWAKGELILIGGGSRPPEVIQRIARLAGGEVLIVPLASGIPAEVSASAKSEFEAKGAKAEVYKCSHENVDQPLCLDQIRAAKLIYFTGGSQNRLMSAFYGSEALKIIRQRFDQDLHLAGTSAGTAIMSEIMITGNALAPHKKLEGVRPSMVETAPGFGFVQTMILDQHFLKRKRQDRLMSAVLDRPQLIGVGIDEATAVHIRADESFEVLGDSGVLVIDAREASIEIKAGFYVFSGQKIQLLKAGDKFGFK